jgi:S-methylmethionine-dependent homocysteine/selenocysteine methylase
MSEYLLYLCCHHGGSTPPAMLDWLPTYSSKLLITAHVVIAMTNAATEGTSSSGSALISRLRDDPRIFLLDGGTGEELFRRNVPDDRKIWSATALVHEEYHQTLKSVHKSFLDAGSQAITTNSYGVVPGVGFSTDEISRYCTTAAMLAREVVGDQANDQSTSLFVLGSLGPLVESYRPDLIMKHDEGVACYDAIVRAMEPYVDCFLAETMSSVEESMQAIAAISKLHLSNRKPCFVSYTLNANGNLRSDEKTLDALKRLLDYSNEKTVDVLGILFNCATPEAITKALQVVHTDSVLLERLVSQRIRLGAYANRLTVVDPKWSLAESTGPQPFRSDLNPQRYYQDFVQEWTQKLGVSIVGGCCGMTPEHISLLSRSI